MRKVTKMIAGSTIALGLVVAGAALPASAVSGSRSCSSSQQVALSSALSGTGGATASTQTTHTHATSGGNFTSNFSGFGTKTSRSGGYSFSSWSATAATAFSSVTAACVAKGV